MTNKKRKSGKKKEKRKEKKRKTSAILPRVTKPYRKKSGIPQVTKPYRKKSRYKKEISSFPKPEEDIIFPGNQKSKKDRLTIDNYRKKKISSRTKRILKSFLMALIFVGILLALLAVIFYYLKTSGTYLDTNPNVKKAIVKEDTVHIYLSADLKGVNKIRFVFLGNREYFLETEEIKSYYEFTSSDIGINSLGELEKVSAVFT